MIPHENAMIHYGKPKRVLGLLERETVVKLSKQLDEKFSEMINKEISKISKGKTEPREPTTGVLQDKDVSWAIPSHIIVFLQRSIENLEISNKRLIL
jgi:hypothetical protein